MSYTMAAQIRRILYRLKRENGVQVFFYRVASVVNDVRTGEIQKTYDVFEVRRAIVLPNQIGRKYSYDLTFLAANKNFEYGAYYDRGTRNFIVELRDLPEVIDLGWSLIYDHKRYTLKEINQFDHNLAMYLTAVEIENQLPFEIHTVNGNVNLVFSEEVSHE